VCVPKVTITTSTSGIMSTCSHCGLTHNQANVTVVSIAQLRRPVLEAAPPSWRAVIRVATVTLVALIAINLFGTP
jgi:hypothetical protein